MKEVTIPNYFGDFLRHLREAREITLRQFALAANWDPANYSKLERGRLAPPQEATKLEVFRQVLQLAPDDKDWRELVRLAALARGEIPAGAMAHAELINHLPALFRWVDGDADDEVLEDLIRAVKKG